MTIYRGQHNLRSMRFLPNEHAAFVDALREAGLDATTVLFVKRRGRLHVELPGRSDTFAFFREKSTKLNAEGRWDEQVAYYLGMDKDHPLQWAAVLLAFSDWLGNR